MPSPLFQPASAATLSAETATVEITVDGRSVAVPEGQMLAAALLVTGTGRLAPLCLMGSCFQCLVTVDGRPNQRSCRIPVVAGMQVAT